MASVKWLKRLFIPVFAILLMSHNAGALSLTQNVDVINDITSGDNYYDIRCINGTTIVATSKVIHNSYNGVLCGELSSPLTGSYKTGDYVSFLVNISSSIKLSTNNVTANFNISPRTTTPLLLVNVETLINNNWEEFHWGTTQDAVSNGQFFNYTIRLTYMLKADTNNLFIGFGSRTDNANLPAFNTSNIPYLNVSFYGANHYRPIGSDADREEAATQDAADDSQDAGDSSSSDAEGATSSLISVIGGFVNVLTTATPTNCKINANLNHIDMGQLDLCANPVPSYIQIIGSIILICAAIPLAIVLFNRFIGLFRSFQG